MDTTLPPGIRLVLLGATERGSGADLVRAAIGDDAEVVHACARCGSSAHGRLVVRAPGARWASVARSDSLTLVAVSERGPVGVDVEDEANAERAAAALATGPESPEPDPAAALQRWCHVEATLKALGTGLAVDAGEVRLAEGDWGGPAIVDVEHEGGLRRVTVHPVTLDGHRASVALLHPVPQSPGSAAP